MALQSYDISEQDAEALLTALKEGRKSITNPDNWCTGAYAKNASGEAVSIGDPTAKRHCLLGSVDHEFWYGKHPLSRSLLSPVAVSDRARMILLLANEDSQYDTLVGVNDIGGHAKALELMDRAIEDFDWLVMRLA